MKIGLIIKHARERRNYTQEYLAYNLGISQNTYSKIERDKIRLSLNRFLSISEILQMEPGLLLVEIKMLNTNYTEEKRREEKRREEKRREEKRREENNHFLNQTKNPYSEYSEYGFSFLQ